MIKTFKSIVASIGILSIFAGASFYITLATSVPTASAQQAGGIPKIHWFEITRKTLPNKIDHQLFYKNVLINESTPKNLRGKYAWSGAPAFIDSANHHDNKTDNTENFQHSYQFNSQTNQLVPAAQTAATAVYHVDLSAPNTFGNPLLYEQLPPFNPNQNTLTYMTFNNKNLTVQTYKSEKHDGKIFVISGTGMLDSRPLQGNPGLIHYFDVRVVRNNQLDWKQVSRQIVTRPQTSMKAWDGWHVDCDELPVNGQNEKVIQVRLRQHNGGVIDTLDPINVQALCGDEECPQPSPPPAPMAYNPNPLVEECEEIEPFCGDGMLQPGEQCDDGNNVNYDGCTAHCEIETCGNGVIESPEQCDDGNLVSGDGCDRFCQTEVCGDGILQPSEECDDGNLVDGDGCNSSCEPEGPVCGDGILQSGEQCDDGNLVSGDGCSSSCVPDSAVCGDGVVHATEECDDGNVINGDGCSNSCEYESSGPPVCGDNICDVQGGESATSCSQDCDPCTPGHCDAAPDGYVCMMMCAPAE